MRSPFPGMDPYLEAYWGDVHTSLVTYARDHLRIQLPKDLRVRVEEHVTVQMADHETQRSLQIIDTRTGHRVVTAIEFLSPWNKSGPAGRAAYRQKQRDLWDASVNLVEIDLVREGQYVMAVPAHVLPLPYLSPYRIGVLRACRPDKAEVYRASLRDPLPNIRIPLRVSDGDVGLDVQVLVNQSYEGGGYDVEIDYRNDPQPPLRGDEAAWADALLREKGRRCDGNRVERVGTVRDQ